MDSQPSLIRKFILWGLAWILVLSLLAGLFLWKTPLGAAEGSQAEDARSPLTLQATPTSGYPVYFPLLFKDGQPAAP
jgi:hypothetical protein